MKRKKKRKETKVEFYFPPPKKKVTSRFLHIWDFRGECGRDEEGACLGRRHLSSHKKRKLNFTSSLKWRMFYLIYTSEALFHFSTLVAKQRVSWVGTVSDFAVRGVARQSDHMIRGHNKAMPWTRHTKAPSLWHLTTSTGTCDA